MGKRELMWVETRHSPPAYDLRDGDNVIGHLRLETAMAWRANADVRGRRWVLARDDNWHKQVNVFVEDEQEAVATFELRWTGGGIVRFRSGVHFCWNRTHIWSTTHCFRRDSRYASVCTSQEVPSRKGSRVTICDDAVDMPETPVLIVLGWFLEVLTCERLLESPVCQ